MQLKISGRIFIFGDNIDTDQIYPGRYLELTAKADIASHCMEGARPGFAKEVKKGDIIVAGKNFGCGSSREHAAITLKEAGISAVVAESFARIFFRNAINLGLPVITCKQIRDRVKEGEILEIDLATGEIINRTTGEIYQGEGLSEFVLRIIENGGIKPLFKEKYGD
ncbi:MAG: 3-isopropylmalate dehydratase small subunit [Thermovenabulum sp.]|uniref:3-isopropylmalate dehydratase small subunit n=1 Tax=Thermovenabulum sp. TaxID=3100335 RepID=UPI003C7DAD07